MKYCAIKLKLKKLCKYGIIKVLKPEGGTFMERMTLERMDHFLRHIKKHAEEVKSGTFNKDITAYSSNLRAAQYLALDISHDMVHVMRVKKFEGYEDADFEFVITLPKNWKEHEFREFDEDSFKIGCRLKATLDYGMVAEKHIILACRDAEQQMTTLANAVQDATVLLKMLEEYSK